MSMKSVLGTAFQLSPNKQMAIFAAVGAVIVGFSTGGIPMPMGLEWLGPYIQSYANVFVKLWALGGGPLVIAFANSTPGPLAPPDPPVVQAATKEAKDMGQIAKALLVGLLFAGALSIPHDAYAKSRVNCTPGVLGCPSASKPVSDVTPAPAPAPATSQPNLIQGVLEALIEVQTQFVADVNTANSEANIMWPPTPAGGTAPAGQGPIDPIAAACFPTLASWASSLALPATPTAPSSGTGPVAVFEDLRVANIVAHDIVQQISSSGFPNPLVIACGGLVTDTVTQEGVDAGQIASFATMLATFIPKPILMKHNVGFLKDYVKAK